MPNTNLVLMTGLPGVGKSTVAQRLVSEYGFAILSTDDLRQAVFRQTYEELAKDGKKRDEVIRKIIDYSKLQILTAGSDLVIDASAPTEKFRRRMLDLPQGLEGSVSKYILHVIADEQTSRIRHNDRGGSEVALETINRYWTEPQDGFCGARLYSIDNNSNQEQLFKEVQRFYEWLRREN